MLLLLRWQALMVRGNIGHDSCERDRRTSGCGRLKNRVMGERTRNAYEAWAAAYDAAQNPHLLLEHDTVLALVEPRSQDHILDAACGTGRHTMAFHHAGARVTGLDFSVGMLTVAAHKCPTVPMVMADLSDVLPFEARSFDKVNCAQALDHVPELRQPFGEFARILKPGGTVVVSVVHPDMNWEGYVRRDDAQGRFRLRSHADFFSHRFCDYFESFDHAGLRLCRLVQLPVGVTIRQYLTPESYEMVRGRYQVVVFQLLKA